MIDFQDRWDKIITLGSRAESRTPNPIFNIAPNEVILGGKAPLPVVLVPHSYRKIPDQGGDP